MNSKKIINELILFMSINYLIKIEVYLLNFTMAEQ